MVCDHSMCELRRLCRHAEQSAQQSPHPTGRPPDDDPHAFTSCPSSTRCRRRSAKTTPGTLSSPPGTPPRSGYPVPIPAHKCPTSSSRPIFAPYIPPLLQYMKRKKRSASHSAFSLLLPGPQVLQFIIEPQVAPVAAGRNIAVLHSLQAHGSPFFCVGAAGKAALVHIGRKLGNVSGRCAFSSGPFPLYQRRKNPVCRSHRCRRPEQTAPWRVVWRPRPRALLTSPTGKCNSGSSRFSTLDFPRRSSR